ncbi:MAG: TonB-dependent receptor, partial [Gammaproteobacteria bacterium]|nr:TonB-dependent receptor [Gammaproteobacteria bacterium]
MQQHKKSGSKWTSFIGGIAVVFAGPVGVQDASAQTGETGTGSRVLEEVVVTAEKRAQSLQDVPIAVTAFTGEAMRDFGISNTQALQATTPGLVFNNTANSAQPFLRGVGTRLALNGLEPSVATYQDDRYLSRATASTIEFADVERVEVLKGPQGTLYGRNATGGAIRVIT